MHIPRYKLIVQTTIGQVKGQGAFIGSRSMWDTANDNAASYAFKNEEIFCTVMVFALYLE
jgi:tctex1 domain-containing protein 2